MEFSVEFLDEGGCMSHSKTIQAVRIILDSLITEHTEIGVYSSGLTASEIRWSENTLTGTTLDYASGIIAPSGISAIKENADWQQCGAPVQYDGLTLLLVDTNQLFLRLKELGVKFTGLTVELHEFVGTEADSDAVEDKVLFTGVCEDPTWTETILEIPVKNNNYKRRALMATVINNTKYGNYLKANDNKNGQIVPITLGRFFPDAVNSSSNQLAKFIRTSELKTVVTNDDGGGNYCDPVDTMIFPIIGVDGSSPYLIYKVKFGTNVHGTWPLSTNYLAGKYIQVVVGGSSDNTSFVGKYRKISHSAIDGTDDTVLYVTLESFFEKDLSGNSTATAINNAWVNISDIPFEYSSDVWPCKGFLDEAGLVIASPDYPRLAVYDSSLNREAKSEEDVYASDGAIIGRTSPAVCQDGFVFIPNYGYSITSATEKNKFEIDLKLFKDSPDKMSTFSIFPCENITKYIADTLDKYVDSSRVKIQNGNNFYSASGYFTGITINSDAGNVSNAYDRNDSTSFEQSVGSTQNIDLWTALQFNLPLTKILIDYDKYYIGINYKSKTSLPHNAVYTLHEGDIRIYMERFMGSIIPIVAYADSNNKYYADESNIELYLQPYSTIVDLPDYYYLVRNHTDNNRAFYFQIPTTAAYRNISGYNLFEIPSVSNKDNLKSIYQLTFTHGVNISSNAYPINISRYLYEIALICEKTISISENIFAMFAGRVFNDTWGSRKTATDLMLNPIDWIEHAKRLQNWKEIGDVKVYGKEYSPNALIKLDANEGSYHEDNTLLDGVRAMRPALQIFDENLAWTDEFTKNMCEQFFLCTRQDSSGYECIHYLDPQNTDETESAVSVTFADIIGDVGTTEEPKSQTVYCEPFINYAYNYGSSKFDKQLRILNTADAAWVGTGTEVSPQYAAGSGWHAEYTPGFTGTDGHALWTACHALWLKFRTLEQPPSTLTDSKPVVLYVDAVKKMTDWIAWMGKSRTSFTVPYTFVSGGIQARDWHVAQKIKFCHPHKTNGWAINCLIEKIEKDKHSGTVKVDVIQLEDIPTAFFLA